MGSAVWSIEQVVALTSRSARFAAGEAVAVPSLWSQTGASGRALWGRYDGSSAEPYDVLVDHETVAYRCTCPSRTHPCKHVIALLVLWVRGHVPPAAEPPAAASFAERAAARAARANAPEPAPAAGAATGEAGGDPGGDIDPPAPAPPDGDGGPDRDAQRNARVERLRAGLVELDRWITDRMRTGLADASIARYATWDELAARLTDARAGALANRIRRLAGKVGAAPDWHDDVLAELGILHLLAQAGQRVPALPPDLADAVAVLCGWQVRSSDVAASAPETDAWLVAGRSDHREDLVEVRRVWLYGTTTRRWGLTLSFAAYRQSLDVSLLPGTLVAADVHRYPGRSLRVIVGERHDQPDDGAGGDPTTAATEAALDIAGACDAIGATLADEPWLERLPVLVHAAPTVGAAPGEWVLTDATGTLPLAPTTPANSDALAVLLAASQGAPVTLAAEWTTAGLVPLAAFLPDRALDIGPRADPSFVSAA